MKPSRIRVDVVETRLIPHVPAPNIIGWKERVYLPNFGSDSLVAKIDSGAQYSSLHATDIRTKWHAGSIRVAFKTSHTEGWPSRFRTYSARIIDVVLVRSSHATLEQRYVIETPVKLGGKTLQVRFGLTDRSDMKFALLLGRDAIDSKFLVDCSGEFLVS